MLEKVSLGQIELPGTDSDRRDVKNHHYCSVGVGVVDGFVVASVAAMFVDAAGCERDWTWMTWSSCRAIAAYIQYFDCHLVVAAAAGYGTDYVVVAVVVDVAFGDIPG